MNKIKLLGHIPVIEVPESEFKAGDGWATYTHAGDQMTWPHEALLNLATVDCRWQAFSMASRETPPLGALVITYEKADGNDDSFPLRFEHEAGVAPIQPDVNQGDIAVVNPDWLSAPYEARIFMDVSGGTPEYRIVSNGRSLSRKFVANGAKFFVQIFKRPLEQFEA